MKNRMENRKKTLPHDSILFAWASEYFEYMPTGIIVYKKDPRHPSASSSKMIGKKVGGDDGHGYLMCMLMGHKAKVHQVVWLIHHGEFPKTPIDHINRNRKDNRIENLRSVSDFENMQNVTSATKPLAGTWKSPKSGRYMARVTHKGKKIYLGYYDTAESANRAFSEAKRLICDKFSPV